MVDLRLSPTGQKQFDKVAEAYGSNADELIATGQSAFRDRSAKPVLVARLKTRKGDYVTLLYRNTTNVRAFEE